MGFGLGIIIEGDRPVYILRYIDWLLTTPLILYVLYGLAVTSSYHSNITLSILLAADIFMIVLGGGASFFEGSIKGLLFSSAH